MNKVTYKSFDDLIASLDEYSSEDQLYIIYEYFMDNVEYTYELLEKSILFQNYFDELVDISFVEKDSDKLRQLRELLYKSSENRYMDNQKGNNTRSLAIGGVLSIVHSLLGEGYPFLECIGKRFEGELKYSLPPQEENGLIKYGVCEDYVFFLMNCLNRLNIPYKIVNGNNIASHVWLFVNLDGEYYHLDVTSCVEARDGVKFNQEKDKSEYLLLSTTNLFVNFPNRRIKSIGDKFFKEEITKDNYIEYEDELNNMFDSSRKK